jgi:3-oxoacyl-[acyl-carrier protein] reductase
MELVKAGRVAGKVAIVTGAGSGIGRAEALLLSSEGAKVVVNSRGNNAASRARLQSVVEEIRAQGGEATACYEGVDTFEGAGKIVNRALEAYGTLDILINNAGVFSPGAVDEMSEGQWDDTLDAKLKGAFATIKFATPIFKRQHAGVIINTSSESGLGAPVSANYCAANEGIIGLTRSIARELGRFGIRCNAIRPRAVDTVMVSRSSDWATRYLPLMQALGPYSLGELGHTLNANFQSEMVAPFVVWLCCDAAAHVNGRDFLIGGDEIGLFSEPRLVRSVMRPGGWDLDNIDSFAANHLTIGLRNCFLAEVLGDKEL